jgi:type IV pilus assembly protein PilB
METRWGQPVAKRKKLGEMLVDAGLLTEDQLHQALAEQKKTDLKLGQYLIRQSIVSETQMMDVLSEQLRIEKFDPARSAADPGLAAVIPSDIALRFQCVPLRKKGRLITVAMTDPNDIAALDTIELLTNQEVEPVICTERIFNQLYGSIYGVNRDLGGVVENIDEMQFAEEPATVAESTSEDLQVSSLQDLATQAPVIRLVNSVLSQAVRDGASDIHISPEQARVSVRFRIDGKLHEVPAPPKSMLLPIISRFKILAGMDIATTRIPQDGRFTVRMEDKEINIRASAIPTIYGENLVLRLLDMGAGHYTLDRLGMFDDDREKIESAIYKPYGMILSTGPTGSGKSTSLYAILRRVNKPDINIITLEDPVEYRVERIRQIQLNRKAGMTFAGGLRSILRQDPDVIMVGEIRDSETAVIGVQAAMTGHRVLSTIHTNDAAGAITRLIDMGIEPFLVSSVLLVSFAQRLVRTVCPYCKEPYQPPERALKQFGLIELEGANFQRGKGCFNCMNTGYKGRIGVLEILLIDDMVQEMILKKQPAPEITRTAQQAGRLRTLKEDAAIKVFKGITTLEEAASAVMA